MTDRPHYREKSIPELLDELNVMAYSRNNTLGFSTILGIFLQHRLTQEQLTQTKRLVYATWSLALVTITLAIITLIVGVD